MTAQPRLLSLNTVVTFRKQLHDPFLICVLWFFLSCSHTIPPGFSIQSFTTLWTASVPSLIFCFPQSSPLARPRSKLSKTTATAIVNKCLMPAGSVLQGPSIRKPTMPTLSPFPSQWVSRSDTPMNAIRPRWCYPGKSKITMDRSRLR